MGIQPDPDAMHSENIFDHQSTVLVSIDANDNDGNTNYFNESEKESIMEIAQRVAEDFNPFDVKRSVGLGVRIFLPMFGTLGFDYALGFDKESAGETAIQQPPGVIYARVEKGFLMSRVQRAS